MNSNEDVHSTLEDPHPSSEVSAIASKTRAKWRKGERSTATISQILDGQNMKSIPEDLAKEEAKEEDAELTKKVDEENIELEALVTKKIETKEKLADFMGYRSKLHSRKTKFLVQKRRESKRNKEKLQGKSNWKLETESESKIEESDDEKDMTWLFELSAEERPKFQRIISSSVDIREDWKSAVNFYWLFRYFLLIGGRMPFHFVKSTYPGDKVVICEMKKCCFNYFAFVLTSIFLLFLTGISMISFLGILSRDFERSDDSNTHDGAELLLFEKYWSTGLIFLTTLTLASVSSIDVLLNGNRFANYITHWERNLYEMNFDASPRIHAVTLIFIALFASYSLMQFALFYWTKSESMSNPFIEGIYLITCLVFRFFVPNLLDSPHRDTFAAITVFLNTYVLYCSWAFVILVVIYSVGITNLAAEWNFRLRLLLPEINVKRNERFLRLVRATLSYQNMFDWHRRIVSLVQETSNTFSIILATFYGCLALAFVGELLSTAFYLIQLLDPVTSTLPHDYKILNTLNTIFHISPPVLIFMMVSLYLSDTGAKVMYAIFHIICHGFMNFTSTHERNFVLSLNMSFTPRLPYLIRVRRFFNIDKCFIIKFLAPLMLIFSVMIQTRIPKAMHIPTLYNCPGSCPGFNLCAGIRQVRISEVEKLTEKSYLLLLTKVPEQVITNSTTRNSTDVCKVTFKEDFTVLDVRNFQLPDACDDQCTAINPYPEGCFEFQTSGIQKPFEQLGPSPQIHDCKNPKNQITDLRKDDCGNLPLFNIVTKKPAKMKAVIVFSGGSYVMCCYDYGYTNGQLEVCNQRSSYYLYWGCGISHQTWSRIHPYTTMFVESTLHPCLRSPNKDPKCDYVNECFCGPNPTVQVPTTGILGTTTFIHCPLP